MTDIRLNEDLELVAAATGDTPLIRGTESLLQELKIEAQTQEGDLWYAPEFGWSLLDFLQAEDDPLTRIEIAARIRNKLARHDEINPESIKVLMEWRNDVLHIQTRFYLYTETELQIIHAAIDRIRIEVETL